MKKILIVICLACLSSYSLAAKDEVSPYEIPKKEFSKMVKTIAILPIQVPDNFKLTEAEKSAIEQKVVKQLDKEGFTIIPPEVYGEINQLMIEQVGGVKNPETGEYDIEKFKAVADHAQREMQFRHQYDALVSLKLKNVQAVFAEDKAIWHGVEYKVKSSGDSPLKFLTGSKFYGKIWANSLQVSFFDRTSKLLFINSGGIEPIMQRNGKSLEATKAETWLKDQKRIKKAIKVALKPL